MAAIHFQAFEHANLEGHIFQYITSVLVHEYFRSESNARNSKERDCFHHD